MIRFILVCWMIAFCWMQSVESTNEFLKNLLTTTPSSSHISDFRQQKRTDSRADKPDMFPGFDLHEDSTTASPRKRRRQAYSKLIRLFLQNTKDRLDTIRDVIRDESELHFRLTRPPVEMGENMDDSMERDEAIRFSNDAEHRQFIDFAFADTTAADEPKNIIKVVDESRNEAAQTYLNSLFAAVGYSRITTTPMPMKSDEAAQGNIITRFLINPLLSAWNTTRAQFNVNNRSSANDNSSDESNDNIESDDQTAIFRVNFFDNGENNKPKLHTNSKSDTNKKSNENRVNNFNYSLPLTQLTPNSVTNVKLTNETTSMTTLTKMIPEENANKVNASQSTFDTEYIGDDHVDSDKKPRNTVRATVDDAATAFRNAFLKYSNYMQHPMEYELFDTSSENAQFAQDNANEMKSDKLLDGTFFGNNVHDMNSSHIQMVPGKKLKANGSMSDSNTIANSANDTIESNGKSFGENAGILILEIFGTVIGMTWRAVSEIPGYFNAQNRSDDA